MPIIIITALALSTGALQLAIGRHVLYSAIVPLTTAASLYVLSM